MLLSRYLTKYSHIISLSKIYYTTALSTLCKALLMNTNSIYNEKSYAMNRIHYKLHKLCFKIY